MDKAGAYRGAPVHVLDSSAAERNQTQVLCRKCECEIIKKKKKKVLKSVKMGPTYLCNVALTHRII